MTRLRRFVAPTLSTLIMFAILMGLGFWQVRRLAWKRGILAAIDHAQIAPAIPLPEHPTQFQKVSVSGFLRPDLNIIYGDDVRDTPQGPQMGGDLIQPLMRRQGPPVLIDRGWVPEKSPVPIPTPEGEISLEGYLRTPDHPRLFTPKDDTLARRFYTLNPDAMAAGLHLPEVAPYTLVVLGAPTDAYPMPATDFPRPPNDHLSYAITWFGLAVTLLVVYASWVRKTLLNPKD